MSYNLNILIDRSERALLRTLGVIERRGFSVESISLPHTATAEQRLAVRVAPRDASRSVAILARQIERLENVRAVEVHALSPIAFAMESRHADRPAFRANGDIGTDYSASSMPVPPARTEANGAVFEDAVQ